MKHPKRYRVANDNTIVDTRENRTLKYSTVRAERNGRITSAVFRLDDGTELKTALHTIDQDGYNLGIGKVSASKRTAKTAKAEADAPPVAPPRVSAITMTREELMQVHSALQSAADLTLKKVVESLRQ